MAKGEAQDDNQDEVAADPDFGVLVGIGYTLCVAFALMAPERLPMYEAQEHLLRGSRWVSVGSSVLAPVESFVHGLYIAGL